MPSPSARAASWCSALVLALEDRAVLACPGPGQVGGCGWSRGSGPGPPVPTDAHPEMVCWARRAPGSCPQLRAVQTLPALWVKQQALPTRLPSAKRAKGAGQGCQLTGDPEMESRDPENPEDGDPEGRVSGWWRIRCVTRWGRRPAPRPQEDTATALQRLVELTASRVLAVRSLGARYRLVRKLGSGSYGRVLLARPRQGGPAVALKLLRREAVLRATFLREFCVGRCVSAHPGLIRTLAGPLQTPRYFAFAQEHAPCGDLSRLLQERGLPELLLKRVVAQLAGALDFLHGRGLVHADVKPDNVLVFDPACSRVALGDLGLTRPEGSPTPAPPQPLPSAPPELCLLLPPDTLPLRPALDSWGLGVLLFCAATASFPWDVALAPDPAFEAFSGWTTSSPRSPEPPPPWGRFAPPALALLRGLLDLDPQTRSPPLAVLEFLGDDWGLEDDREGAGGFESGPEEDAEEEGDGESGLEDWTEEEEEGEDGRRGRKMGTDGGAPSLGD
ncbi:putative serine/threonine-protein kinase SBK3 [Galemys pyrenaicus]|uniref:Putative serine/threonine-protein kinase SBK3 n=1 Tax=Galemys pyrenaicus TaxID=202257 RepID=A0A8J6DSU0_GALPY|nr:putative serine/threonine-protein kinase SBK3 [Galemys pyrenaicus]